MAHKIIAVRYDQRKDGATLTGLTQSPRGTRTMSGKVQMTLPPKDKEKRNEEFLKALDELLGSEA